MATGIKRSLAKAAGLVALLAFGAALLTILRPDWLEVLFGLDPDEGNGSVELAVTIGLFLVAAILGTFSVLTLRRRTLDVQTSAPGR